MKQDLIFVKNYKIFFLAIYNENTPIVVDDIIFYDKGHKIHVVKPFHLTDKLFKDDCDMLETPYKYSVYDKSDIVSRNNSVIAKECFVTKQSECFDTQFEYIFGNLYIPIELLDDLKINKNVLIKVNETNDKMVCDEYNFTFMGQEFSIQFNKHKIKSETTKKRESIFEKLNTYSVNENIEKFLLYMKENGIKIEDVI